MNRFIAFISHDTVPAKHNLIRLNDKLMSCSSRTRYLVEKRHHENKGCVANVIKCFLFREINRSVFWHPNYA